MVNAKYLRMIIVITAIITVMFPVPVYAQPPQPLETVNIYAWTDKIYYEPGEGGKLTIVIRNDRTDVDLILYNVTIRYPWFAYTGEKWDGNDTINLSPLPTLEKNGGSKALTAEFTVPMDGRVTSLYGPSSISITAYVDKLPYSYNGSATIYVKSTPFFISIENFDKFITLLTIQVVLLIVCAIIIAAVIFLSTRTPREVCTEGEKEGESKQP